MTDGPREGKLAARLQHLLKIHTAPGKKPPTTRDLALEMTEVGCPVSHSFVARLINGQNANPTLQHLEALAQVFGVPTKYFVDDDTAEKVNRDLELLQALRDSGVRVIALRARGLSPGSQEIVIKMIEQARLLEGLPNEPIPAETERADL